MPSLQSNPETTAAAIKTWQLALRHALDRRLNAAAVEDAFEQTLSQHPLPGAELANVLLSFRARRLVDDPLIFHYTRTLLRLKALNTGDMLLSLLAHTDLFKEHPGGQPPNRLSVFPTLEERMFLLLAETFTRSTTMPSRQELHRVVLGLARWLRAVSDFEQSQQVNSGGLRTLDTLTYTAYEALASLALSVFGRPGFKVVSKQSWWAKRRAVIVSVLQGFDLHVLQFTQSQLAGRLTALTQLPPFLELDNRGRPKLTHEHILRTILQDNAVTTSPTRAGLYLWLSACLKGRPRMDDLTVHGYLQNRYRGDNQTLTVHLVHAAFDVLTNALVRAETAHTVEKYRSFICNKLPLLLSAYLPVLSQAVLESCLQSAVLSIAMDPIPPISAGSSEATETLRRTRLEFVRACVLHGLMSERAISTITADRTSSPAKFVRYTREGLLSQVTGNTARLEALVSELSSMQGNAGAISTCIVQLINNLCATKDSMTLKSVCVILVKKLPYVDIILQYTQPVNLLGPLCTFLKDWTHDQDQVEYTPEYEEFASILLFLLAVLHRFDLDERDVGLADTDLFVFRMLKGPHTSTPLSELTAEQNSQLTKWLEAMFTTDEQGETGGIGDEVMRQCPPEAFYMLVPTLFEQSVLACRSGNLFIATFKAGLELLLEPLLLPSLVGGLSWLIAHSWADHGDADILLQILDKLLRPASRSSDVQPMHQAVRAIVARPLKQSLEDYLRKRPERTNVKGMIAYLNTLDDPTVGGPSQDLAQWSARNAGDIKSKVRSCVQELVAWGGIVTANPPAKATPTLLDAASILLEPDEILKIMVNVLANTPFPGTAIALDVCTALVCSPIKCSQALRQKLGDHVSDIEVLLNSNSIEATALVRLHQSVEAQLALPEVAMPATDATEQIMAELGLAGDSQTNMAVEQTTDSVVPPISDADITSAFGQSANLTNEMNAELSNLVSAEGMAPATAGIFDNLNMELSENSGLNLQQPPPVSDGDGAAATQAGLEDDIFADLDMSMGALGDDLDFGT